MVKLTLEVELDIEELVRELKSPSPLRRILPLTGRILLIGVSPEEGMGIGNILNGNTPIPIAPGDIVIGPQRDTPDRGYPAQPDRKRWIAVEPIDPTVITTRRRKPRLPPEHFDEWYAIYPKKVARKDAEAAFAHLMRTGAKISELMEATKNYIRKIAIEGTEPQFIKHPASFLRNERWRDYVPSVQGTAKTPMTEAELDSIREKFKSGEYTEAIVRRIEKKYAVSIIQ